MSRLILGRSPFAIVQDIHILEHVPRLVSFFFLFPPVLSVRADGIHSLILVSLQADLIVRKEAWMRQNHDEEHRKAQEEQEPEAGYF